MKALAKERQRRYESPIALSQDIERFLNHEPVSAGPPSAAYRFKKFVRRNRPQVVAAALVLVALVCGIIGTTLELFEARRRQRFAVTESAEKEKARQAEASERKKAVEAERRARNEADKARAINEFLTNDRLTQAEPANNAAEDKVTLLEVLDRADVEGTEGEAARRLDSEAGSGEEGIECSWMSPIRNCNALLVARKVKWQALAVWRTASQECSLSLGLGRSDN